MNPSQTLTSPLPAEVTCEIVLAEVCYLLSASHRAVDQILALPAQGRVTVEAVLPVQSEALRAAIAKYWPAMDVADGCVLQLAARYPRAKIITTDLRDFRIHRRPGGQSLNLIHP